MIEDIINRVGRAERPSAGDLATLIGLEDPDRVAELREAACSVKESTVGRIAYFRGLIEFSNVCSRNCSYCGIRMGNRRVRRYTMTVDEIVEAARWAFEHEYGSIVLQAGERRDREFVSFIEELLARIQGDTHGQLGVTLSVGEQSRATYRRWHAAGAHRYLLRIETSNEALFRKIHPRGYSFAKRRACLDILREEGYQVGTGVMIGLPGQTLEDLAGDILFFKEMDVDMVGMGPYIAHEDTPLGAVANGADAERRLELALNMISVTRLTLPRINIASATALQALSPAGREWGLLAGANVMMPNVTPVEYRREYLLYPNKPCLDDDPERCTVCLRRRIEGIGETIGYGKRGDSPRFAERAGVPKAAV